MSQYLIKYLNFHGEKIPIKKGEDGIWRTKEGTEIALRRDDTLTDPDPRPGISPFVVPLGTPLDDASRVHDYMYECDVFEKYYARIEADKTWKDLFKQSATGAWIVLKKPAYSLIRLFGRLGSWKGKER